MGSDLEPEVPRYEEAGIAPYTLPAILTLPSGRVETPTAFLTRARPYWLDFLRREVYGCPPPLTVAVETTLVSETDGALDGLAVRRELRLLFRAATGRERETLLLFYAPRTTPPGGVPVFFGLNFKGNPATTPEPEVRFSPGAPDSVSGAQSERWCLRDTVARGYAVCTACYQDFYPDRADGWADSIYPVFWPEPRPTDTALSAWAWGLLQMLAALRLFPEADPERAIVHGHSRLGKTALWAGALDPRIAAVISNGSGCLGAALSRRKIGETLEIITRQFPHWFVPGLRRWAGREEALPFDQHVLLGLIAPRPLCVGSAAEDLWADPKGEYLGLAGASEAYGLFGVPALAETDFPAAGEQDVPGVLSYHLRPGPHDQTRLDWRHYWNFAAQHFGAREMNDFLA